MVGIGVFFALFALAIAYLGVFSLPSSPAEDTSLSSAAQSTLSVLKGSPGLPADWEEDPSTLERLGLLRPGTTITLSQDKLEKLQPGDPSNVVTYDQARDALGLEDHELRIQGDPIFTGDENRSALQGYDAGYVGRYESGNEDPVSVAGSNTLDLTAVTYNDSLASGEDIGEDPGDKYKDDRNFIKGHLLPRLAGLHHNEDTNGVGTNGHYWKIFDTQDPDAGVDDWHRNILTTSHWDGSDWTYNDGETDRIYVARVNLTDWDASDTVWFNFSHNAAGDPATLDTNDDEGHVETRPVDSPTDTWTQENTEEFIRDGELHAFENESVTLSNAKGDEVYVSLEWRTSAVEGAGAGWFVGNWSVEGIKDDEEVTLVENTLDYTTTNHHVLVVGSKVNQGQLSEDQPKQGLQQWIEAGGDIVSLGSDQGGGSLQWLAPWLSENMQGGNDDLLPGASNVTHPLLNSPHSLPYLRWNLTDNAYGITEADPFTHVLLREDGDGGEAPALSVSNVDAQGDGDLVLSAHKSGDLPPGHRQDLFENSLIWTRYRGLYVDLGPQPDVGDAVGSAQSATLVDATLGGLDYPHYDLTVHVWK